MTAAADDGGFDHPGSLVLRAPLELDDEGMHELSGVLREAVDRARQISARAVERGDGAISAEVSVLLFERRA